MSRVNVVTTIIMFAINGQTKSKQHMEDSGKDDLSIFSSRHSMSVRVTAIKQLFQGKQKQIETKQ